MKRFGSEAWNGGLREGKGSVSTENRVPETYPYTFFSRYGEKPGTNPEELLGAAHAACSSDYSAWRTSCRSRSTANRSRHRHGRRWLFPSPRSISPSPRKIPGIDQAAFGTS
jgi:organic hydroperoxide reductase OsmC/OhrA